MVELKFFLPELLDRMQQETGEQMESGHRKFDYGGGQSCGYHVWG